MTSTYPPFWGAGIRFSATSALFFLLAALRGTGLPKGQAVYGTLAYGVLGFGTTNALFYYAPQGTSAGLASLILSVVPLATIFLAAIQGQEHLAWQGLAGGLIAVGGTLMVFLEQLRLSAPIISLFALSGAVICISESSILLKRFPNSDSLSTLAVSSFIGSAILLALSVLRHEAWTAPNNVRTWGSLVFLVVFGSIAFVMYLYVLAEWPAAATNYSFVVIPTVTILLAWILLGESVSLIFALGSFLVLFGVYLRVLSRPGEKKRSNPSP